MAEKAETQLINPLFSMLGGRTNTLALVVLSVLGVLAFRDQISAQEFAQWATAVFGIGAGGNAIKGAARAFNGK